MLRMLCHPQQRLYAAIWSYSLSIILFVQVVHVHENVAILADLLLTTSHGGYPVVQQADNGTEVFAGLVSRFEVK